MEELKLKGKIVKILEAESGTSKAGKSWIKQNFVIDTGASYNPEVCFEVFGQEKVDNLQKYNKVGQEVEVSFNISSREYNGKYFHNLSAWKIWAGGKNEKSEIEQLAKTIDAEDDGLPF